MNIFQYVSDKEMAAALAGRRTVDQIRAYQTTAIDLAINKPNVALLLGVGTGKTMIGLTAAWLRMQEFNCYGALIVAPKLVKDLVWRQEAQKWEHLHKLTFSEMVVKSKREHYNKKLERWVGKRVVDTVTWDEHAQFYLINYENLEQLANWFIQTKQRPPFNMVIFDELSKMSNHEAKRCRAMMKLYREVGGVHFRLGMTGTPATNGLMRLFGEYHALDGGQRLGTSKTNFRNTLFLQLESGKWVPRGGTRDVILRRTVDMTYYADKREELNLPPVNILDRWVDLPEGLMTQYRQLETEFFTYLDDNIEIEVFNAASLSNKCLQFANGAIYTRSNDFGSAKNIHALKLDMLEQLVEELDGQPLIVCYQFRMEELRIRERFPHAVTLRSGPKAMQIQEAWDRGEIEMLIGHPASMGHGLNLQYAGCNLAWFGLNWDLELYEQAIGRLDRDGQTRPVMVFRIMTRDTMELAVKLSLKEKFTTQSDYLAAIRHYQQLRGAN